MRPFRNSGWDYLTQMESIIPVSGPKGHHTFAVSSARMMTNQSDDGEEKDLPDAIKAVGSSQAGAVVGAMHIDQFPIKTSVSSSSKRRHSLINIDTHPSPSSHAKSAPTTIASSEPTTRNTVPRKANSQQDHLLPTNPILLLPEQPRSPRTQFSTACKAP
jgi:hypothetical protein